MREIYANFDDLSKKRDYKQRGQSFSELKYCYKIFFKSFAKISFCEINVIEGGKFEFCNILRVSCFLSMLDTHRASTGLVYNCKVLNLL